MNARKSLLFAILLVVIGASSLVERHFALKCVEPHHSDLYAPWFGTRVLLHRGNPYSPEVTRQIQIWFYGRPFRAGDGDQQAFVYPVTSVFIFAPLAILPWHTARLLLTLLLPPLVILSGWCWARVLGIPATCSLVGAILLIAVTWPAVWAYQQTQPSVVILSMVALACFLLRRGADIPAGLLFALTAIKPNLVAPLLFWLCVWALARRNYRFLLSFAGLSAILLGASELVFSGWMPFWLQSVSAYSTPTKTPVFILVFGHRFGILASVALCLICAWALARLRLPDAASRSFGIAVSLILALTLCLIPAHLWMIYNYLALTPAVLLLFFDASIRADQRRIVIFLIGVMVLATPLSAALMLAFGYSKPLLAVSFISIEIPLVCSLAMAGAALRPRAETVNW